MHTTVKSRKYCGSIYTICFGAITKNGYDIPGPVFLQNGCTLKPSKNAPHEPSRYWLWSKAYRIRLLVLFWGTTTRRYTCWRLIIFDLSRFSLDSSSLTGIRSGYDQGAKAPEEFCGGKRVFCTWSRRVPALCSMLSTGRVQQSCYVHGLYVWTCGRTCRGAQNGWILKWNSFEWKSEKAKINQKTKKDNERSSSAEQCTWYTIHQWLSTKNNQKQLETIHNSHIQLYTCAIIPQKQVLCSFGQSRGSCGVLFTWFEYVPVFEWKWTRYTCFWLLPYYVRSIYISSSMRRIWAPTKLCQKIRLYGNL